MIQLTTERLVLRPWAESDAETLYEYARDERVGPVTGWPAHTSPEESRRILKAVLMPDDNAAVTLRQSGELVGCLGIKNNAVCPGEPEIGYWIGVPHWGNGYMPEAVRAALKMLFTERAAGRVWCGHYEGNDKSRRVIEKCGFRYQLDREEDVTLMGERRRCFYYAITREEWESDGR